MTNSLSFSLENGYLEVRSDGEKDYNRARDLWTQVGEICRQHDCYRVLGIARTTKPLQRFDAYEHYRIFEAAGIDHRYRIAWVEFDPRQMEVLRLVETVAWNAGVSLLRLFDDVDTARDWLLSDQSSPVA